MPVVHLVDYNTVLKHAQDYYENRAVGNNEAAEVCLTNYFTKHSPKRIL